MVIESIETRGGPGALEVISEQPRVWVADDFLTAAEADALRALAPAPDSDAARALGGKKDETGFSFEMPVGLDSRVADLRMRVSDLMGVPNALDETFRFRRYEPGEGHPEHLDCFEINGAHLIFTALVHLEDGADGGATSFPYAKGGTVTVAPRKGRLVVWANHTPDGAEDPLSKHSGEALASGSKTTLTWFVYAPRRAAAHTPGSGPYVPPPQGPGERLYYVNQSVPEETTTQFKAACADRGVEFIEVSTWGFDFSEPSPLEPGDMMYRPAVSGVAMRAEQHLYVDGVATLHHEDDGPFFDTGASLALFERAGVPIPRSIYCHTTNRTQLRRYVERLGGFPVLAKFPGGSGGQNMVLLQSPEGLYSFMDYSLNQGSHPWLTTFIPGAEHWRVVVVGEQAVAAYRNRMETDDFRTYDAEDPEDYRLPDDPDILRCAERAVKALRVEFGGVDVLAHPSGRNYVLEANFPCYFGSIKGVSGIDVAGAILDHLQVKARRLAQKKGVAHG